MRKFKVVLHDGTILRHFDMAENDHLDHMIAHYVPEAEQQASARFPTCPTCGGSGMDESTYVPATHLTPSEIERCPDRCARGAVITDELVEVGAKALADYRGDPVYSECSKPWSAHDEEATRAVLAAVVTHIKEGTE